MLTIGESRIAQRGPKVILLIVESLEARVSDRKIHFMASSADEAQDSLVVMKRRYGQSALEEAEVIVALGGDGFVLNTLHQTLETGVPVYGMNRGTVGFLMNEYIARDLPTRLVQAETATIHPLRMQAEDTHGETFEALAINEVALLRETRQTANIAIHIDGKMRMPKLICDGVLVATPAGSTAYNFSAHGPIIPMGAPLIALTAISAFRPRRWRGALLTDEARITFEVLNPKKRPVSATADTTEVRDVKHVEIEVAKDHALNLLFDPDHGLEERFLSEQFAP